MGNRLIKFLVNSNIWVAIAVVSLCYLGVEQAPVLPMSFLAFVFFATIFAYSYMRLVQYHGFSQLVLGSLSPQAWITLIYSLFSGFFTLFFLREIYKPGILGVLLVPVLVSFLYPITFQRADKGFTSLRVIPGLKLFLISLTWSYVTVLLPQVLYGQINSLTFTEFVFRIVFIAALVIPFDIRDLAHDDPGMQTLPQVMGYKKARELAAFGIFIYQLWLLFKVFLFDADLWMSLAQLAAIEVGAILIRKATPEKPDTYFSFWIEAIPIFAAVATILIGILS